MNCLKAKKCIFKSLFSILILLLLADSLYSQELNLGMPLNDQSTNIFRDSDPFSEMLKAASTQSLIEISQTGAVKLGLADSISWSADRKKLELRLKQAVSFTNRRLIQTEDLLESFKLCKAIAPEISQFFEFNSYIKQDRIYLQAFDNRNQPANAVEKVTGLENFIADCPLLYSKAIKIFGSNIGNYNLLVSTGPYLLVNRIKNREARLELLSGSLGWARAINLRAIRDAEQGLSAIRIGTLDLFYTQDSEALEKASNDQTLLIKNCGVYKVIHRKGLFFECQDSSGRLVRVNPAKMGYVKD